MVMVAESPVLPRYKVGALTTRNSADVLALIQATSGSTSARYDSLDQRRGTAYTVATGKTLRINKLTWGWAVAAGTAIQLLVGYGDDRVANSVAAPTNAVTVAEFAIVPANGPLQELDVVISIPAGKVPFVVVTGGAGYCMAFGNEV